MGSYMGSIGMWYKDGIFYELENRHINFFLRHPGILGFSEEEKQKLCESNGLPADAIYCDESDSQLIQKDIPNFENKESEEDEDEDDGKDYPLAA